MRRSTGRVLRTGGLVAAAAAPLTAMLVFSAGPTLAGTRPGPQPAPIPGALAYGGGGGQLPEPPGCPC
jgi:hypothetical protein